MKTKAQPSGTKRGPSGTKRSVTQGPRISTSKKTGLPVIHGAVTVVGDDGVERRARDLHKLGR